MAGPRTRSRSDRPRVATLLVLAVLATACAQPAETAEPAVTPRASPSLSLASPSVSPRSLAPPSPTPAPRSAASATPRAADGVYLALGDSITFGIGVPRPQEEGYVARVAHALADPASSIAIGETRVFAVPGETATGFLERRLDDVLRAIDDHGVRVELVTIGLGANELLRARRDPACDADPEGAACRAVVDAATAVAVDALDRIVGEIQEALAGVGSDARVLLLAYYNPDPDPLADAAVAGPDGAVGCTTEEPGLADRIACVAADRRTEIVDLHAAFRGRELELTRFRGGDVHPNAAGYAAIAEAILAVVEAPRP